MESVESQQEENNPPSLQIYTWKSIQFHLINYWHYSTCTHLTQQLHLLLAGFVDQLILISKDLWIITPIFPVALCH